MNHSIDIIRQSIYERRQLEFRYHELPRVVEPMCLGEGKGGVWQLRAHQVGGRSASSRSFPDGVPRLFDVADMFDISVLPIEFDIPSFYARGDTKFIRIDTEL